MKQKAKESIIKQLTKACAEENIDTNLELLSDKELKDLYLKFQAVRRGILPYGISKGEDFVITMKSGNLQRVTFRDTYKFGVRRLTFKEFLLLCEFVEENPKMYSSLNDWKYR